MAIVKGAGLLMKAIIEEGDEALGKRMQAMALAEGSLIRNMSTALFTQSTDNRMLTHRQLSRHLVALWMVNNEPAKALLSRIIPIGLLDYLASKEPVPEKDIDRMHIRDSLKVASVR
jgi:DnaJ family protein C protein 13